MTAPRARPGFVFHVYLPDEDRLACDFDGLHVMAVVRAGWIDRVDAAQICSDCASEIRQHGVGQLAYDRDG